MRPHVRALRTDPAAGFSSAVARWAATNLVHLDERNPAAGLTWLFDLQGIQELYDSYVLLRACLCLSSLFITFVPALGHTSRPQSHTPQ